MAPQQNAGAGAEAELPDYAGHYRLESRLGSGGMGVVHLARSTSGMKLAVKVVHAEFARDPEFRGRFRQEVGAARRVSGAFTAPVVDADPEAERPWMATLFIPGPTLSEHVKRNGPMAPAQLRRLMAGLAEALRDIHRVGVVHRDLKPSNVLLAEDGPKVIDFGISRPKDSELRTETGKLIGTPPFMAPEQFRRPREVGPAADVFALGSVLVHAATGRGPFDSDSPYVVAYQVVHDDPDLTGVPDELAPLVLRCLAKEPEDRPTPDELMRELRSVAASYDTQAFIPAQRTGDAPGPEPRARETEKPKRTERTEKPDGPGRRPGRRAGGRAVLGAGALGLAAIVALAAVQLSGGDGTAPGTGAPRAASAGSGPWVASGSGNGTPRCSHGAGKLLCAQTGRVFALDPSDGRLLWRRTVTAAEGSGPPVVAGGLVLLPSARGGRLEALDPASGTTRWQRNTPAYGGLASAGGTLLLTGADGRVTGVDGASGEKRWSRRVPGHERPYFTSFAGNPLAYAASASDDGTSTRVTAVDPDSGEVRWDARLEGALEPVGTTGETVFLTSADGVYGDTDAVVRYTPATGATRRVALPVPLEQAHGTVHGNVVHLMAAGGSLVAVDLEAGRRLWSLETGLARGSAPVTDGRTVYVTAPDGRLLAVDARGGRLLGQTPPRLGADSGRIAADLPEPVVVGHRVHASAPDGTVFAVDGRDPAAW
ncbi:serine/threonine-protein kinase [Streptomyces sp. Tu 3180]|uniref:serine/threonine-protein kinase n=1 Tax=Streptomyces sp. Tu 3180 TaxID=2682611 RepID=UPI00135A75D4|nr:serine/threonine-protein kinase [Streptomyces sp. Tu 3180]KAF3466724.1 PQQ-binding-like beta-propeller repeat protein [Streptomyces sp. Tu 3180]